MNIGLKFPLASVKERIREYLAPYPWLANIVLGRQGKLIYLLSLALVTIWIGYGQLYRPISEKLERVQKRLEQTAKKINDLKDEFPDIATEQKTLQEKDNAIEQIRERLKQEEKYLPVRAELDQVLAQLTNAEGGPSVSVVSVKPVENVKNAKQKTQGKKTAEDTSFYPIETFEIELLSRFWDLVSYLSRLEQVSPYFSFPLISIDAVKSKSAYPLVKLQVSTLLNENTPESMQDNFIFKSDIAPIEKTGESRDPFGAKATLDGDLTDPKFKLTGIIWQGGRKIAIINNEALQEGDQLGNATIASIGDNKVTLNENGFPHELSLST